MMRRLNCPIVMFTEIRTVFDPAVFAASRRPAGNKALADAGSIVLILPKDDTHGVDHEWCRVLVNDRVLWAREIEVRSFSDEVCDAEE